MPESDDDLEVFQQKYEEEVGEIQKRVDRLEHITGIPKEDKEPRATVFHRLDLMEARGDSQGSLLVRVDALEKFQKKVEPKVDDLDKMVLKWDQKLATEMNTIYEKLSLVQGQLTSQLNLNEELDKKNADRFDNVARMWTFAWQSSRSLPKSIIKSIHNTTGTWRDSPIKSKTCNQA